MNRFKILLLNAAMLVLTSSTIKSAEATPASQSFKDLMDVMYNCAALPNQSYEESCGKWYERFKDQVNTPNANGSTPLHIAASPLPEFPRLAVLQALIKIGADVNAQDYDGETPLNSLRVEKELVKATIKEAHPGCDQACKERFSKLLERFRQGEQFLIQNGAKAATVTSYDASTFSRCAWLGGKYCKLDQ